MNPLPTNAPPHPQLRANSLGLSELVFQAITHIAPASNVVFAFPIIALKAGPVMPISLLLATIVCLFIGNTVSQFSRYMPSGGGYYSFATRGLGSRIGFMATWSYLVYEIPGNAGLTGFLGYFVSDMLHTEFKINIPWWLVSLATIALVWTLTYRGIQLSARITEILGGIEVLIMIAMSVTFLLHPGKGSSYIAPLNPFNAPNHFGGVLAGMVFSILALSGFEAPAPMAQETRRPASFIAKAITLSLLTIGGFYIFTSYAAAIGWGTGDMAAFASNANPYYVLGRAFWGIGWWSVVLALINSAVGVGLAATNATSRVMYTMGRAGTLPAKFAHIHPVHQTPTFAIRFIQIACTISILLVGFLLKPETIFGFLETVATLAVIVLYVMSNLALTRYMRREQPEHFSSWQHGIVPWLATLCLLPVLFVTIYPQPAWPYNITPCVFAVAMVLGLAFMKWRESSNPGALDRAAAMLTRATDVVE
ncbi:MAG: APC family permease [Acidobacteria bacterium]|nr:APC family permease [Acidobacteriota bacterium]